MIPSRLNAMLHHTLRDHFEAYLKELVPQLGHAAVFPVSKTTAMA